MVRAGQLGTGSHVCGALQLCASWVHRPPRFSAHVLQVIRHVRARQGHAARLFAVGFSAGSNCLAKYVGEMGAACPLTAAAVVANGFDIRRGLEYIHNKARLLDRCEGPATMRETGDAVAPNECDCIHKPSRGLLRSQRDAQSGLPHYMP